MAEQLQSEMFMIDMIFEVLEILQIMIDVITFYDLFVGENPFDSGTFAGKGLVNAGFTLYYMIMRYAYPEDEEEVVVVEEEGLAL